MCHDRSMLALRPVRTLAALTVLTLAGCTSSPSEEPEATPSAPSSRRRPLAERDPDRGRDVEPTETATPEPEPPDPISVAALSQADLTGGDLRLGAVRERTAGYTSYDVTFASTTSGAGSPPLRISGVLNVPTGPGPFPAVVLAHGYIDPAVLRPRPGDDA